MLAFQPRLDALSLRLKELGITPTKRAAGSQLASRLGRMAVPYVAGQHVIATAAAVTGPGV
jgi:hypothetical protein